MRYLVISLFLFLSSSWAGVNLTGPSEFYERTSNIPDEQTLSFVVWVRPASLTNSWDSILAIGADSPSGDFLEWGYNSSTTNQWYMYDGVGTRNEGTTPNTDQWYSVAGTVGSGTMSMWIDIHEDSTVDITDSTIINPTSVFIAIGTGNNSNDDDIVNGDLFNLKIWDGEALTAEQLQNESRSIRPLHTDNLWGWFPFLHTGSDEIDLSGNGNDWTVTGTPVNAINYSIPWK